LNHEGHEGRRTLGDALAGDRRSPGPQGGPAAFVALSGFFMIFMPAWFSDQESE